MNERQLDFVLIPRYIPPDTQATTFRLPSLLRKAQTFSDVRINRACRRLATHGERLSQRARSWTSDDDFMGNKLTIQLFSAYSITYQEELLMAKKTSAPSSFNRAEWHGFLERPMTPDEIDAAEKWDVSPAEMWEAVNNLEKQGYSVKMSYSRKLGVSTASMGAGDELGKLSGWSLSARGRNGEHAFKLLLYKHYHLLDED